MIILYIKHSDNIAKHYTCNIYFKQNRNDNQKLKKKEMKEKKFEKKM